ncbi:MAG: class III extradiol ring-cleavage dioxygenase [Steroidobacteraceae bacterium]
MTTLPTLFVSHGSPMHALVPGEAGAAWGAIAAGLPRPRAVLVASAHWETGLPMLSSGTRHATIHDFGGFPAPLYELRYDAPGAPDVAREAAALLEASGLVPALNGCRGLDHGAWVPLRWMYPGLDVPVLELSVQPSLGPEHHLQVGEALAPLARDGVLVLGSGHVTHNLHDWMRHHRDPEPLPYARAFADWLAGALASGDRAALLDYRSRAPSAVRAHPTEEHFLPIYVALGAAGPGARATRVHASIEGGALAMDAWRFDPA